MTILLYISLFIIAYVYIGYPLMIVCIGQLVGLFRKKFHSTNTLSQDLPHVTILIAAYNEVDYLEAKVKNTLSLVYPEDKKSIIVVTDGSTDGSEILVSRYAQVQLFHAPERKGKVAAINRVLSSVVSDIVLFTDANVSLNEDALHHLVPHFENPLIGAVAGEKKVSDGKEKGAVAVEGLYWKYESMIRKADAYVHSVTGAAGELFAIRTELLKQMPEGLICDDLYMSLQVIDQGFRVGYDDKAYGVESYSFSIMKEWKRKIRIAAGSIQMLGMIDWWKLLRQRPVPVFQFVNRKIVRWIVVPYLVILIPFFVVFVGLNNAGVLLTAAILLSVVFYSWALLGGVLISLKFIPRFFYLPFYFVWANLAMIAGTWQYLFGRSFSVWEKVR